MGATVRSDTTLLVSLDQDDATAAQYPDGPRYVSRENMRQVVAHLNATAGEIQEEFRYVGTLGDDNVPKTVGWDVRIMEALEKTPFAFGNDLYPGREPGTLCCHVFMRSQVVQALGYFGPPSFRHMYVDPVWMAWGEAVGITYLDDVILEHMHYTCGKAPADASYHASSALMEEDCATYNRYMTDPEGFNADVAKLRGIQWSDEQIDGFRYKLNIPRRWGDVTPWNGGQ